MAEAAESNIFTLTRRADPDRLQQAASVRRLHFYTAASGTSVDDWMTPGFWERIAAKFQPLDRIEIVDDDATYFAELIVLDTLGGLRLAPLRGVDLQGTGPRDAMPRDKTGIHAIYRGPHLRWCAFRGEVLLKDRFETERDCLQWIAGHAKAAAK